MATIRLILGFGIFALFGMVAFEVIPPYFHNYEFEDSIKSEALQSTYTNRSEDDVRTAVIRQAHSYDIDLTAKQVHVTRTSGVGNNSLSIEAEYSVPLNLPGYSTTLDFHPSTQNRGIF